MSPDAPVHLNASERASLRRGVDADALERLLAAIPEPARASVLAGFRRGSKSVPVSSEDPHLHELLQDVWAPTGARIPPPGTPYTHRITLALADELPRAAGAMIVREAGSAHDFIVFTEATANVAQLHEALGTLSSHRARHGQPPARGYRMFLERVSVPTDGPGAAEAVAALERGAMGSSLRALRAAPRGEPGRYGAVSTVSYGPEPHRP
jgi:hypothetical protein